MGCVRSAFAVALICALGTVVAVNGDAANDAASLARLAEGGKFRYVHWNIGHFALGLAPQTADAPVVVKREVNKPKW